MSCQFAFLKKRGNWSEKPPGSQAGDGYMKVINTSVFPLLPHYYLFSLDGPLPSVMQEVDLPIIENNVCEGMYRQAGFIEHIPEIFICAGYAAGGKDSCEVIITIYPSQKQATKEVFLQGDSGGPMVVQKEDGRFMLSGVISWGIGCAEKNQPGVYTRISEFSDWIQQILQF